MTRKYGQDRLWPLAEGGGVTILLATVLLGALLALRLVWTNLLTNLLLILAIGLWLAVLWFFRDPKRRISAETHVIVSPADGQVVKISQEFEPQFLQAPARRISIFLDVYHVHVQRIPFAGRVTRVQHQPGQFLQAFRPEASDVNEHIAMLVESESHGVYLVKQIAGIMARRCVNYLRPGDTVPTGQRFGLIRFGSRVDLFLPLEADIIASLGQRVYGGVTPIAQFKAGAAHEG